ncbi:hypothetical protein NLU13_1003 [Sarocladium strictum]|uniref:Zn(2)-C6 fungal-type domain-containing protein n=1 Tax=Sarocladium strictum TaxID=5046 RepID=A0AA39LBU1_SARSR|nr:hypothetical protein NLU13_1003 [Sarocladium strictum]
MDGGGPSPTNSLSSVSKASRSRPGPSRPDAAAKRIRVTQACDQCREVKRKCDVTVPVCSPCAAQGQLCTYTRSTKKRGTQPGYMRALETALAWVLEDVPGSQESLHRLLGGGGPGSPGPGEIHNEQKMGALRARWRDSQLFEDMSAVLKSEEWMGAAASQGSTTGKPGGPAGAGSYVDGNTPSTMCESEEEGGGQWPIL